MSIADNSGGNHLVEMSTSTRELAKAQIAEIEKTTTKKRKKRVIEDDETPMEIDSKDSKADMEQAPSKKIKMPSKQAKEAKSTQKKPKPAPSIAKEVDVQTKMLLSEKIAKSTVARLVYY